MWVIMAVCFLYVMCFVHYLGKEWVDEFFIFGTVINHYQISEINFVFLFFLPQYTFFPITVCPLPPTLCCFYTVITVGIGFHCQDNKKIVLDAKMFKRFTWPYISIGVENMLRILRISPHWCMPCYKFHSYDETIKTLDCALIFTQFLNWCVYL